MSFFVQSYTMCCSIILSIYWFITNFLLKVFPFRNQNNDSIRTNISIIGHRGGSMNGPENTMYTFVANDCLLDMIECDVFLTKDNQIVICHDLELNRLCHVDKERIAPYSTHHTRINQCSSFDLPYLNSSVPLHFPTRNVKSYSMNEKSNSNPSNDQNTDHVIHNDPYYFEDYINNIQKGPDCDIRIRMTLLEDLFKAFPHKPIHIDLKPKSRLLIDKTVDLLIKYNRLGWTVLGTSNPSNESNIKSVLKRRKKQIVKLYNNPSYQYLLKPPFHFYKDEEVKYKYRNKYHEEMLKDNKIKPKKMYIDEHHDDIFELSLDQKQKVFFTFAGLKSVHRTFLLYLTGLLPFYDIPFDFFSVPGLTYKELYMDIFGYIDSLNKDILNECSNQSLSESFWFLPIKQKINIIKHLLFGSIKSWLWQRTNFWNHLSSREVKIFVWVINCYTSLQQLKTLPIDGTMTDNVPFLVKHSHKL